MAENISNDFTTTLNGALDATQTNVTVVSSTGSPTANFRIRVDDELMLVTSKGSGLDWTVTRNVEGTAGATHASGATVAHLITTGGLAQYLAERYMAFGTGTADTRTFLRGDMAWSRTWNVATKATDQTKTSTTALAADTDLQLAVSASKKYRIRIRAYVTVASGTPDLKFRITGPTSPTLVNLVSLQGTNEGTGPTYNPPQSAFDAADRVLFWTAAGNGIADADVLLHNGANAGTVALQWAQNTSSVDAAIVRAGSFVEYSQID